MKTQYFSPGPSSLPKSVLQRVHDELKDSFGIGVSILEISHRSEFYQRLNEETLSLLRKILCVPEGHEILLTSLGAQHHFCLIPLELADEGDTLAYANTGVWASLAIEEASLAGRKVVVVFQDASGTFRSLGLPETWEIPKEAKYLHLTINNTVYGTEYAKIPDGFDVPLVLDMTSALGSRTDIPWDKTALIYASAQKNFGIAGVSIVIIRKDFLEKSARHSQMSKLGRAISYDSIFKSKSILNTPPVFPIFVLNRMLQWMDILGGVNKFESLAKERAQLVYHQLDQGLYHVWPDKKNRSRHNFVFRCNNNEMDQLFIQEAAKVGILEIKGFSSLGGLRCSMYNAIELSSAKIFAHFLESFREKFGQ